MTDKQNCPACGAELPPDSPSGICVPCALRQVLDLNPADPPNNAARATVHLSFLPSEQSGDRLTADQSVGPQGRFLLHHKLGEGGMGEVWLASDKELGQVGMAHFVALKFLSPAIQCHPKALAALRAEVLNSQKLSHPNIVRIFDLHSTPGGQPFIKMEFVAGQSLSKWLREQPDQVMPWRMAAQLAQQISGALRYAHESVHIVHRDLKPGNILMTESGVYKLADFGIAMDWKPTSLPGREDTIMGLGTLAYASPQQLAGQRTSPEDDIYALGVTLYEALTGTLLFDDHSVEGLINKVHYERPQPILARLTERGCNNEVPTRLTALVQRCLEKDPLLRPKARDIPFLLPAAEEFGKPPRLAGEQAAELWQEEPVARSYHWLWTILFIAFTSFVVAVWQNWGGLRDKFSPRTFSERLPEPKESQATAVTVASASSTIAETNKSATLTNLTQEPAPPATPVAVPVTPLATPRRDQVIRQPPPQKQADLRRGTSWVNSLGMKFQFDERLSSPTAEAIWVCETETSQDNFRQFITATGIDLGTNMYSVTSNGWKQLGYSWANPGPGFLQSSEHPAVGINWFDASAFCDWLTKYERSIGWLAINQVYVLPTTNQWFRLATVTNRFVLHESIIPMKNFSGSEITNAPWPACWPFLTNHYDAYTRTAPPRREFKNDRSLYHISGNVAEWCKEQVLCGRSWADGESGAGLNGEDFETDLRLPGIQPMPLADRHDRNGFRVVLIEYK